MKYRSLWPKFILRSKTHSPKVWQSSIKYYLRYKAKTLDHEKIDHCDLHCLRAKAALHWLIITKYNVKTSNSLQDIRQNHWTMKYRSQWPINILRSDIGSYWLIVQEYDVQLLNSFQDTRQNHWTMKCRSQWPTFILGQTSGHTDL